MASHVSAKRKSAKPTYRFHLFNCDNTCALDEVKLLLNAVEKRVSSFKISVENHAFSRNRMSEMVEKTIPKLKMDYAVFVVHAHECSLSFNEDSSYGKIYNALKKRTGSDEKILIVVGGDDKYNNNDDEEQQFISRWARETISLQFHKELLDGRKSFIFSWHEKYRAIHQEALLHYFDADKKGQKFEPQTKLPADCNNPSSTQMDQVAPAVNEQDEAANDEQNVAAAECHIQETEGENAGAGVSTGGSNSGYPEGTVLLETRLRDGKLSYDVNDVVRRENGWQPPDEIVQALERNHASTRDAKVRMVAHENGIDQSVDIIKNSTWDYCAIL